MDDIDLLTQQGYARTRTLGDQATQGRQRRLRRSMLEELADTQDENRKLIRERHALREENARAVELVRQLADRSEAFRRLVNHLRQAWAPADPVELVLKDDLKPLIDAKKRELAEDGAWAKARDESIESRVRPPKQNPAGTKAR